jgi:hypothetical protein
MTPALWKTIIKVLITLFEIVTDEYLNEIRFKYLPNVEPPLANLWCVRVENWVHGGGPLEQIDTNDILFRLVKDSPLVEFAVRFFDPLFLRLFGFLERKRSEDGTVHHEQDLNLLPGILAKPFVEHAAFQGIENSLHV